MDIEAVSNLWLKPGLGRDRLRSNIPETIGVQRFQI